MFFAEPEVAMHPDVRPCDEELICPSCRAPGSVPIDAASAYRMVGVPVLLCRFVPNSESLAGKVAELDGGR